jgi:DNA-directed RNA polymerase subunit K/omega
MMGIENKDGSADGRQMQVMNKYERAIVAAMEARRLNDITRVTGESLSARVTQMAIENVRVGKVQFYYEAPDEIPADDAPEAAPADEDDEE